MKTVFKRFLSLFLVLSLIGAMLPAVYAQDDSASVDEPTVLTEADYIGADAVFAQIDAMEEEPAKKNATQTQLSQAAEALVLASDNYVEGSLERNGNTFTWMTVEGIRCIYDPQTRERKSHTEASSDTTPSGIYNEPVAKKGGWPSSNEVYLIGPYYHDSSEPFTDQYKNEATDIAEAIGDTDGYTLYSGTAATVDKVAEALSNGAVVIFDSHGTTDYTNPSDEYDYVTGATSSYLCLSSKTGLTTEDFNNGDALYGSGNEAYVNGTAIAKRMTSDNPGGIVWMAICLGMATDGFYVPFREKGVEVVYGYSQSVTFDGDYLWEEIFWDNMCAGETVAGSISDMKSKCGEWDYCSKMYSYAGWSADDYGPITTIGEAREYYYAFPIVVSDEDTHPGQRSSSSYGADSLQTVKSTYTLFTQYEITAQSNNESYGTVSVSGSTVTAVPAEGYFAESASVLSGTANVTQDGNKFTVKADSDCTVQINFAPKTAVTVSFSGATVTSQNGYAGDAMELPTVTAPEDYTFLGWMTAPLSGDTTEKPTFYTDSFTPTASTTLYALYSYVEEGSGTGTGDYVKVTSTPADWSGEYVIVYEADGYIFDGSLDTFDAVSNYQEVTISDNTISAEEADAYKFTIAAVDGGYSIQGTSGGYIGHGSNANGLTTGTSALVNSISLSADGSANIVGSGGAYLRYNATSGQYRFRYYKTSSYSSQKAIALYLKDGSAGTTCYTSNPTKCEHTNTVEVAAVAATCTQSGFTAGVQCTDCETYISGHEVVEATGHSWSDWAQTKTPTCTAAGEQTRTCGTCGETETQSIAATGHSMDEGKITTAATCTADGVMTYTCTACGDTVTESIAATGHSMDEGKITTAATCTADGVMTYTCGSCGTTETQAIAATGHDYVLADGIYTCSSCGDSYEAPVVSSLHYVFSDYTAGTQYAQGEVHKLDDIVTLTINKAHLNSQIRLYAGSNAVFDSANAIDSIIVKAGYKADTLNVYGSVDGETWTLVKTQSTTTTYTEYTIDMPDGTAYTYVKLESVGAQIRVSEMTVNFLTSDTTDPSKPTDPTDPSEPEETEPEEAEPVEPVSGSYQLVTDAADITSGGQFVIAVEQDGTYIALNDTMGAVAVTVTDNCVVYDDTVPVWTISASDSGITLMSDGKYLTQTGKTSASLQAEVHVWNMADGDTSGSFWLSSEDYATRAIGYRVSSNVFKTYATSNSSDSDYNFDLYLFKLVEENEEPKVDTWNVTLGDDLKVNFYADIPADCLENTVIRVTVAGESTDYSDLTADSDGKYPVSVTLAATQMTEQITLAFVVDGTQTSTQTYTVRQYADTVLADQSKSDCHALVKEMLNYGAMAQTYFGYNTADLANAGITGAAAADIPTAAEQEMSVTGELDGIRFYGASLVYRNKLAVRFYFKVTGDIGAYSFGEYAPVQSGTLYYVEVADITPNALDAQITLTVTDTNGNTLTVSYSPMSYMVRMNAKDSDSLKALLKALYNYHLAAKAYIA